MLLNTFKKKTNTMMDVYLKHYLLIDVLIILGLIALSEIICARGWWCLNINRDSLDALLNELVSSSVSVGGFIIASLTIIVTMKDNVAKPIEESKNGLELIMNSQHYKSIVSIFKVGAWIFVVTFLGFSLLEVLKNELIDKYALYLIMIGLGFTIMALIRCLFVLNNIINLQIKASLVGKK